MTDKAWGVVTAIAAVFAAYFLLAGGQLRTDPPTPAEDAVGLGLLVIGGAFVIATIIGFIGWLNARSSGQQPPAT